MLEGWYTEITLMGINKQPTNLVYIMSTKMNRHIKQESRTNLGYPTSNYFQLGEIFPIQKPMNYK